MVIFPVEGHEITPRNIRNEAAPAYKPPKTGGVIQTVCLGIITGSSYPGRSRCKSFICIEEEQTALQSLVLSLAAPAGGKVGLLQVVRRLDGTLADCDDTARCRTLLVETQVGVAKDVHQAVWLIDEGLPEFTLRDVRGERPI